MTKEKYISIYASYGPSLNESANGTELTFGVEETVVYPNNVYLTLMPSNKKTFFGGYYEAQW
jgi:hypothetical protein